MKIALTLAAFAAAGMFAAGDRRLPTPSQMPEPAKVAGVDFSTPPVDDVLPIDVPMPMEAPDQVDGAVTCGCGGTSSVDEQKSDEDWEIEGCATGIDDEEPDIPSGTTDRVR